MKDITAVVCTHRLERWPWLLECLASLERQILQPLEVIVVVDGSPEIIERLKTRSGPENILSTPLPSGLSAARNLGLEHASGRYVAFLDDDAVAEESWLKNLRAVLMDETVAGVGGVSLPNWEGQRPPWLPDQLLWTLGCSLPGNACHTVGGTECIWWISLLPARHIQPVRWIQPQPRPNARRTGGLRRDRIVHTSTQPVTRASICS